MASGFVIRKNQYYDSVFLMSVNRRISEVKGVQQTAVLMGSLPTINSCWILASRMPRSTPPSPTT